jgi:RHS repeat-associated protein
LDGVKLNVVSGSYGADGAEYRTERGNYARVRSFGQTSSGEPEFFEVRTRDGRILEYGATLNSTERTLGAGGGFDFRTLAWHLSSVRDRTPAQNRMSFGYAQISGDSPRYTIAVQDFSAVSQIIYGQTGDGTQFSVGQVNLIYEDRPDPSEEFISGYPHHLGKRLERIEVRGETGSALELAWTYELSYIESQTTGRSLLRSVTRCDANGVCLPATEFGWNEPELDYSPVDLGEMEDHPTPADWTKVWLVDVDGDGRDDLVYTTWTGTGFVSGHPVVVTRLSTGTDFAPPVILDIPNTPEQAAVANVRPLEATKSRFADMDEDGDLEFLAVIQVPGTDNDEIHIYDWQNGEFELVSTIVSAFAASFDGMKVVDLNGDALPDLLHRLPTTGDWVYSLNSVDGFNFLAPQPFPGLHTANVSENMGDLDGDGRTELLIDWTSYGLDLVGDVETIGEAQGDPFSICEYLADLNGDGLPDCVQVDDAPGNNPTLRIFKGVNTGLEFSEEVLEIQPGETFPIPPEEIDLPGTDDFIDLIDFPDMVQFYDFNRDGRDDVLLLDTGQAAIDQTVSAVGTQSFLLLSNGSGPRQILPLPSNRDFRLRHGGLDGFLLDINSGIKNWSGTAVGDINGDGWLDIVQVVHDDDYDSFFDLNAPAEPSFAPNGSVPRLELLLATPSIEPGTGPDTISIIVDGGGRTDEIDYQPLLSDAHTPAEQCFYPQRCMKRGVDIAVRHRVRPAEDSPDAALASWHIYTYDEARIDLVGRGFLGFGCFTDVDVLNDRLIETCFDHSEESASDLCPGYAYPKAGLPASVRVLTAGEGADPGREVLIDNQYRIEHYTGFYTTQLEHSTTKTYEGAADSGNPPAITEEAVFQYDWLGNRVEHTLTVKNAAGQTVDTLRRFTRYDNFTEDWLIGLPYEDTIENEHNGLKKRRANPHHNPTTGLLEMVEVQPQADADQKLEVHYERDGYGLVREIREVGVEQERVTSIDYDDENLYPFRYENAEGHVTFLGYHHWVGEPVIAVDPNGVETRWQFDGFGRLRHETREDGFTRDLHYLDEPSFLTDGPDGPLVVSEELSTGEQSASVFDGIGRETKRVWRQFDASLYAFSTITYDDFDREVRSSIPETLGTSAPLREFIVRRDNLDRVVSFENPDGSERTWTYPSILESRTFDEEAFEHRILRDAAGRVIESIAIVGGNQINTQYKYSAFGNVREITDDQNNVTIIEHDDLGRRTRVVDPDTGERRSFYTPFGELREDRYANSFDFYDYDRVGRLIQSIQDTDPTTFTWDLCASGVGSLCGATSPDDVTTTFTYDGLGRIESKSWNVAGGMTLEFDYDNVGRLEEILYPEVPERPRFRALYRYTASGRLSRILDFLDASTFWEAEARDPTEQLTRERFGDQLFRDLDYHPETRLLSSITTSRAGTPLGEDSYDHYLNANLLHRTEIVHEGGSTRQTNETFQYDALNRLRRWTSAGHKTLDVEYRYETIGNLDEVIEHQAPGGGAGPTIDYRYDRTFNAGPHGLTRLGEWEYRYDFLGRQTERRQNGAVEQTRVYTPFDLTRRIERPGEAAVEFKYDAEQRRALKATSESEFTAYADEFYERRNDHEHIFYILAGSRRVAQVTYDDQTEDERREYLLDDPLGSVSAVANEAGQIIGRHYHAPFGRRTASDGSPVQEPEVAGITRGFTGHEHDDLLGLINMKGRLYDPVARRFLTADPIAGQRIREPLVCILGNCGDDSPVGAVPMANDKGELGNFRPQVVANETLTGSNGRFAAGISSQRQQASGGLVNTGGTRALQFPDALVAIDLNPAPSMVDVQNPAQFDRYGYALGNPMRFRDPDGFVFETVWDIANIAIGVASLADNVRKGNYVAAAVDAAGVIVDTAAAVVPGAPGGAGTAIKASRAGEKVASAISVADKAADAAKAAKGTDRAADAGKAAGGRPGKEGIYEFKGKSGKDYVGQSSDIDRRLSEHARTGKLPKESADMVTRTEVKGGKTTREVAEQKRIDEKGGIRELENKVNPIGPKRRELLK